MTNTDSNVFKDLENSMLDMSKNLYGTRSSDYLYRLGAKADGFIANVSFTPTPTILLSRILAVNKQTNKRFDITFATDIDSLTFDGLDFHFHSPQEEAKVQSFLMDLTTCINYHHNWKYVVNYKKLCRILGSTTKYDKLLREMDVDYSSNHDINQIIKLVVNKLGMDKAETVLHASFSLSTLAKLWYQGLRCLVIDLHQYKMNSDMNTMNFGNHQKDLRRFEQ